MVCIEQISSYLSKGVLGEGGNLNSQYTFKVIMGYLCCQVIMGQTCVMSNDHVTMFGDDVMYVCIM